MRCLGSDNTRFPSLMAEMRPSGIQPAQAPWVPPCAQTVQAGGVWCEKCNNRLVELKRQVLRLILPEIQSFFHSGTTPNTGSLSSRIFSQIGLPESHLKSWHADQCQVCSTHLNQLKWEAVSMVHTLEESQFLAYYNIPGYVVGPNAQQVLRKMEKQRPPVNVVTAEQSDRGLVCARPEDAASSSSFLHRAAQKLNLSSKKKVKRNHKDGPQTSDVPQTRHAQKETSPYPFPTKFKEVLRSSSPTVPAALQKTSPKRRDGKVKVMLRICPSFIGESASVMKVDTKRKQITLYDPSTATHVSTAKRKMGVAAPKIFAFDAIYEASAKQSDVCSGTLVDILQTVVGGSDACVFTYGHAGLGKTYSMIGRDENDQTLGILPSALSWLFRLINEQKQKTGTKFSVRVSAVEIVGRSENWRDLLASATTGTDNGSNETPSPSEFLRDDRTEGVQLMNPSELRASSAEKAAFYLDAALAARTRSSTEKPSVDGGLEKDETRNSHMFFTVHIYQVEKHSKNSKVHGGRSRLHLIDLASCEGYTGSKKDSGASSMSIAGLGNVIIALINGAKHLPHKGSKITRMLQESIGNPSCRTTMIAHVSPSLPFYAETLGIAQLASRLHRLRKRKGKGSSTSSSGGESSCDESRIRKPRLRTAEPKLRTTAIPNRLREDTREEAENSDYNSSTGEESCDTVIYVGPDGELSDRDLTDHEGPPSIHHYKTSPLAKGKSPWEECETTRSLKRKLEAIENPDQEDDEETEGRETPIATKEREEINEEEILTEEREPEEKAAEINEINETVQTTDETQELNFVEEIEEEEEEEEEEEREEAEEEKEDENKVDVAENTPDCSQQNKEDASQELDTFDDDYFEELRELEFLDQTLDKNLVHSDEEFELQEKDFLPNFTENPSFLSEDLSFLPSRHVLSDIQLKETAKYALSKAECLLEVESDNIEALEDWNEAAADVAAIIKYHKQLTSKSIQGDGYPVDQSLSKSIKKSHTSKSSSSDASSSDAESIVLPEKPCFSFMTCDAVNVDDNEPKTTGKRLSGSFIKIKGDVGLGYRPDVTAKLVEACQPEGFFSQDGGACYVVEEHHSPDELYYDDTELIWGEKEDDLRTVTVLYLDERGQGIEKEVKKALSEEMLFPDLDQKLYDVNLVCDGRESEISFKMEGSTDSFDSDPDLPPRSPAMDTPMKLFYHLVPSPQSSSNEELDESQSSKAKLMAAKSLSPIQECPSRESSLNRSSDSLNIQSLRDQNYNVVNTSELGNGRKVETNEREITSPPAKYFRTVEHEQNGNPTKPGNSPPQKYDACSMLQRFVADQIMESQAASQLTRPKPQQPVGTNRVTPTRGNRRCRVISPNDPSSQDILIPPLTPHRRSVTDRARVIRSPKLGVQREREYGSDVVSYRRDYQDDSSDSSLTTRTEPWNPVRPRPLFPPHQVKQSIITNVTFLGSEEATLSNTHTKVVSVEDLKEAEDEIRHSQELDKENCDRVNYSQEDNARRSREAKKNQEFGYQSEPEVCRNKNSNRKQKHKRDERGYVSEGEGKLSKTKCDRSNSFVRLTYQGSEVSGSEAEVRRPRLHQSEPHVGRYGNLKRPSISREAIDPKTPYAPQKDFKVRQGQRRSLPKIIYRFSGEYGAVVTTAGATTGYPRPVLSYSVEGMHNTSSSRLGSTSTVNSNGLTLAKSNSRVWVMTDPPTSCEEMTADEQSVPGTPVCASRGRRLNKLRLFSRDRGSSYSSGHASDSSVNDSPGPRKSRLNSLRRSKSVSNRSDAASSSGYESMRNDTSHASSDSCSERGSSKKKKKRGLHKRSNSAPPSNRRRSRSPRRWFSRKSLDDPIEIKVYHVDDMDKLQKFMRSEANEETFTRLRGLKEQQSVLKAELRRSRQRLVDDEKRWSYGLRAEGMFPVDDPRLAQALEMENVMLEKRINTCKSKLMMVTSFDVIVTEV
ncbi:uncharacterized protein LOC116306087 [Actinia tenebrosa]|uniref:Uncharacterized protein LOC116306087 n=1 Tax=Actinia tenebrosa TaxID=6105 RepID=A0A6P8J2X4_ACTTE|nr:uncharacterized protein LOC116306087 [Actinia tenebrosa]